MDAPLKRWRFVFVSCRGVYMWHWAGTFARTLMLLTVVVPWGAQFSAAQPLWVGMNAAVTHTHLSGYGSNDRWDRSRWAPTASVFAAYRFSEWGTLRGELRYSVRGGGRAYPAGTLYVSEVDVTVRYEYLEVPILVEWTPYTWGTERDARLHLRGGAVVSSLIECQYGRRQAGATPPLRMVFAPCQALEASRPEGATFASPWGIELGLAGDASVSVDVRQDTRLSLDIRWYYGLRGVDRYESPDLRHRGTSFGLGIARTL